METPVPGVAGVLAQDAEIDGTSYPAGTKCTILIGAANTDGAEFPDPETVDFEREGNRHLGFGGGIHRCLGSHLARLELRVALEEFHRRIPDYEFAPDAAPTYTAGLRSVENLDLVFTPGGLTSRSPLTFTQHRYQHLYPTALPKRVHGPRRRRARGEPGNGGRGLLRVRRHVEAPGAQHVDDELRQLARREPGVDQRADEPRDASRLSNSGFGPRRSRPVALRCRDAVFEEPGHSTGP